ncbi:hypothetical protein GW17_00044973 [Ensete ventricosum]|nr:hypothetical protein GW17_00044973 [Ensete ventricosum]
METTIPSLITSSSRCPDWVGGPEEPLVSDLEENLCPSRVKWDQRRPKMGQLWPVSSPSESSRGLSSGLLGHTRNVSVTVRRLSLRHSDFSTYPRSGGSAVPHCRVAPFELVAVGAFLAVVLTEGRPTVEMPTSASTGECAGRWFASSQSMPGPGG